MSNLISETDELGRVMNYEYTENDFVFNVTVVNSLYNGFIYESSSLVRETNTHVH